MNLIIENKIWYAYFMQSRKDKQWRIDYESVLSNSFDNLMSPAKICGMFF